MKLEHLARRWTASGCAILMVGAASVGLAVAAPAPEASAATPALTASQTHLAFHGVTLGTYAGPTDVTVTNTSSSSDKVTGYRFSGDDDFFFDSAQDQCVQVLAPGTSCTLAFDFVPGALGTRTETVNVIDTAHSGLSISMTGLGSVGYYEVTSAGDILTAGDAGYYGNLSGSPLNEPIVGLAPTGDDGGYWLVASDGGIFSFGDARFLGSAGGIALNKPIVGMAATAGRGGYWLVASDGGIFSYGDAGFYGSTGALNLNKPIVGMAATPDDRGYWLVASDGGIFAFGDAGFYGSTGALRLNKPIVGMASTPDGRGYWLVASDGGVFAFGDARFYGSTGNITLNQPIVGMASMPDGGGYWFAAADGGLFNFGSAPFYGSGTGPHVGVVVGMATDGDATFQSGTHRPAVRVARPDGPHSRVAPGTPHFAGS
jgi:hypothetical protein